MQVQVLGGQCGSMGRVVVVLLLVAGVRAEVGTGEVTCSDPVLPSSGETVRDQQGGPPQHPAGRGRGGPAPGSLLPPGAHYTVDTQCGGGNTDPGHQLHAGPGHGGLGAAEGLHQRERARVQVGDGN